MSQALQQLKQLVLSGGFDEESRKEVENFEKQFQEVAIREKFAKDPLIKQYIDYLQSEIDRAETLLRTDRTLTDRERDALFNRIELAEKFTSIFTGATKRREELESTINDLLNVAKTR